MGSFRTKEDDVDRIATSIFITNFPESTTAKDLFIACSQYGHVIDSYIPNKKSKSGKRFGFVKFINVFSNDRLINNLCTVWIGRSKLHANIARFLRSSGKKDGVGVKKPVVIPTPKAQIKLPVTGSHMGVAGNTFASAVIPGIVLDESCLNNSDLSTVLIAKMKEFAAISNLKKVLREEGFADLKIKYLGELWVMLEFSSMMLKNAFKTNVGVSSWFSEIRQASHEFVTEGRIAWIDVEGVPLKFWSNNTFKKIASKWGMLMDVDDCNESCYYSKRLCVVTKTPGNIFENVKIVFGGKTYWIRAKEASGWIPEFEEDGEEEQDDGDGIENDEFEIKEGEVEVKVETPEPVIEEGRGTQEVKSEDPFGIYSLLKKTKKGEQDDYNTSSEADNSIKYPPGFTPAVSEMEGESNVKPEHGLIRESEVVFKKSNDAEDSNENIVIDNGKAESHTSVRFKNSTAPRKGGSILELLEEVVKVGKVMGFKMDRCEDNITEIIESQGAARVFQ
ncbi:nucleotide-binding alpha-beta plait domain-containing protein [Tanacetum coccineum]